jgi:hypothetical protein
MSVEEIDVNSCVVGSVNVPNRSIARLLAQVQEPREIRALHSVPSGGLIDCRDLGQVLEHAGPCHPARDQPQYRLDEKGSPEDSERALPVKNTSADDEPASREVLRCLREQALGFDRN